MDLGGTHSVPGPGLWHEEAGWGSLVWWPRGDSVRSGGAVAGSPWSVAPEVEVSQAGAGLLSPSKLPYGLWLIFHTLQMRKFIS